MKILLSGVLLFSALSLYASSEMELLKKRIKQLEKFQLKTELSQMSEQQTNFLIDTSTRFKGGQTAQQALNPEISVVTDMYGLEQLNRNHRDSGFKLRVLGFHIQSDLDPFSKAFLGLEVHPGEGTEIGEAFVDFFQFDKLSIRVGKFLQHFGVINRWHMPSLDQFDNPLVFGQLVGEKINQMGVSLHWMMPALFATSNELYFEITNTDNTTMFGSAANNPEPSYLLRLVNYYDLSQNSYINWGISGLVGKNNTYQTEKERWSKLVGTDFTFLYEPVGSAMYHSFLFRTELFYELKEIINNGLKDEIKAYGMYAYGQMKLNERYTVGVRYDYSTPLELSATGKYSWQVVPYITYWQSPWVKMRLQYNYLKHHATDEDEQKIIGQIVFAMGPHKHERY